MSGRVHQWWRWSAVGIGLWAAVSATQAGASSHAPLSPRAQYMLKCAGCHQADGTGTLHGDVPSMRGAIGHFTRLREGRSFLVQVPGTLNAGLNDQEIAALLNWMVPTYADGSLPADFQPYTEDEVAQWRRTAPANVAGRREALVRTLREAGYSVP